MNETSDNNVTAVESPRKTAARRAVRQTREMRLARLRSCGLMMLCFMAIFMVLTGAIGSIKWDSDLVRLFYPDAAHRYAAAALNLSTGLIFWIALIGVYLPARWGLKLNVIGCIWYLVGTIVWEIWQGGKVAWAESMSDIMFWGAVPIIQMVCIVVGSSRNPAIIGTETAYA